MRPPYCCRGEIRRRPRAMAVVARGVGGLEALEGRWLLSGTPTFTVAFDDPTGTYSQWYSRVRATILAAADDWAQYIDSNASIQLSVDFDSTLTAPTLATAGFDQRVFFSQGPGYEVQIGNVAAELRTGVDQNGSQPDAEISIRPGALGEMYFDTSADRSGTVPNNEIDARSVLTHELGHALGIFGTGGGPHDTPEGDRLVYDQYVTYTNGELEFTGPNAEAAYGGPVPLSVDDSSHVGNDSGPGADLANDLMAPAIADGDKRFISAVDLGMLADAGVPMKETLIPALSVGDVSANRVGGGTADFVITLSKASAQAVTVPVKTVNGTAVAGRDYVATSQTVTFAPGETSKTVSVQLLAGSKFTGDNQFYLNLGMPTDAVLVRGQGTATLHNAVTAADAKHPATIKDASGNAITVSLRGAGVATVNRDSSGNLDTISITGSNGGTVLVIRSKKASVLHGMTAAGGLGGIDAPNTSFGGTMNLKGTGKVSLLDVLAGSAMTFANGGKQLVLVARNIADSTITAGGVVKSFTATSWTDADNAGDLLKAAGVMTFTVKGEMQADVDSAGGMGRFSAGTLRDAVVHAGGSVNSVTAGSAIGSDVFVGTNVFASSAGDFVNRKAVLKNFAVRAKGVFSDTRVSAPGINSAALGAINVSNGGNVLGVAADSIGVVTGSTPGNPKLKRTGLKTPQMISEGDFVVRVV